MRGRCSYPGSGADDAFAIGFGACDGAILPAGVLPPPSPPPPSAADELAALRARVAEQDVEIARLTAQ